MRKSRYEEAQQPNQINLDNFVIALTCQFYRIKVVPGT